MLNGAMPSSDDMLGLGNRSFPAQLRPVHHVPDICEVDFFGLASSSSSAAPVHHGLPTMTLTVKHDLAHDTGSSDDVHPHKKTKFKDDLRDQTELEVTTDAPDHAHAVLAIDDVPVSKKSKNVEDPHNLTAPDDLLEVPGESLRVDDAPPYKKIKINPYDDALGDDVVRLLTSSGFGESDLNVLENAPPTKKYRVTRKQPD